MKYIFYISLVLVSCSKPQMDDCFTSLGKERVELRQVGDFSKLYVEDRIEVELVQDNNNEGSIELIGPGNLLEQITAKIEDDELRLTNTNTCNFVRSYNYSIKVKVNIKNLSRLQLASIASVRSSDTLFLNRLEIYHNALSDIDLTLNCSDGVYVQSLNSATTILKGKARALTGSIEEVSLLDARNLLCEEVLLDTHTPLDCFVNASKGLFIKIYNSGNVFYVQEPSSYKALDVKRGSGDLLLLQ